ncbi:MAG: HIT family protein [Cytophagales bacterium]|nr:HIT family protein [Marinoscillum sp.]PDH45502.1 MAG: HIT family protein [Rhodothermaeota bacterium MED-G18]|tara:strand:- start:2321 stop:2713 length:393 start_codon:yes stop_codon:yes gene_type:complete
MSTIFSKIIKKEIPAHIIFDDKDFISFLDINPLTLGHSLVVPKVETDYLFDLENKYLEKILIFSKKISGALKSSVSCRRVGLKVVGLEVPHAHIHLIPFNNEKEMDFINKRLSFSQDELRDLLEIIKSNL